MNDSTKARARAKLAQVGADIERLSKRRQAAWFEGRGGVSVTTAMLFDLYEEKRHLLMETRDVE